MKNCASGIFIIKPQRLAALFYPAPSVNVEHIVHVHSDITLIRQACNMAGKIVDLTIVDLSHSERRQDVSNLPRPNAGMFSLTMASTKNYAKKKNTFLCLVFL